MSLSGILVGLVLALIVVVIVAAPLLSRRAEPPVEGDRVSDRQRERFRLYYERVLRNLRDLDEDQALGKIEPELYERDRAMWVERGVQALKALDTLSQRERLAQTPDEDAAIDRAIEDAVEDAARRAKQGTS